MNIQQFAEKYSVELKRDSCGHPVVAGWQFAKDMRRREYHSHIFDGFKDGSLGVCLLFDSRREWTKAKKDLLAQGFRLKQDAETEGTLLFDPENEAQCLAAIRTCCIRRVEISEAPVYAASESDLALETV